MPNHATLGPIQPHTEAKHDILKHHLGAWFPIHASASDRLQYIDGFAGPGEYEGGEVGSPILALEVISNHVSINKFIQGGKRIDFLFVEKEQRFADSLRNRISRTQWPDVFNIDVRTGEFEVVLRELLDAVDARRRIMPPTLLFIDPFGSAGFPMGLMARLGRYNRIDMLINFNYIDLVRWLLSDASKHVTLDGLYGSPRWRPALQMAGEERKEFLIQEYGGALQEAGWRGTNFEMINNQNQTQYYLFFGTQSPRGMQVMKRAMRNVSPDGLFRYRDRTNPAQQRFMGMGMDAEYARELADYLFRTYRGREALKDTLINDDVAWHPRWIDKDLTAALMLLEGSTPTRIASVRNSDGRPRRRNSFPPGSIITFGS